jgi:hypothetical protein
MAVPLGFLHENDRDPLSHLGGYGHLRNASALAIPLKSGVA